MSILFHGDDESCIDPVAFARRRFPADRVLRALCYLGLKKGDVPDVFFVKKSMYAQLKNQLGHQWDGRIFTPYNCVEVKER